MYQIRTAGQEDIPVIRELAKMIWPPTYSAILDKDQIDYMMNLIYSPSSLLRQMYQRGHIFLLLEYNGAPAGFASYSVHRESEKVKLEKIYVNPKLQGKGLGLGLLNTVIERTRETGLNRLQLNVNRYNKARYFYEKQGFRIISEEDIDIGNGFFMNDYVMERSTVDGER